MSNTLNTLKQAKLDQLNRFLSDRKDLSGQHIVSISQEQGSQAVGQPVITVEDPEVINLLRWLAKTQGITPEVALKKAVATAAYMYDTTTNQGGKLFVERPDKSVGEILLK